jgi:pentalenene oxygenase
MPRASERPRERATVGRFGVARALLDWRGGPLTALSTLAATEHAVVAPRFGIPVRVVFDPDLAREVLVTDADSYTRPWPVTSTMRDGLGATLFISTGDEAATRRRLYAPVFARAHSDELAAIMTSTMTDELDGWRPGPVADLQAPLTDLTLRTALRALLGVDVATNDRGTQLHRHFEVVIGWINHRFTHPASPPSVVPTPRNRAMRGARSELQAIVRGLIAERRATGADSMDVLGLLLRAQAGSDGGPTDEEIVTECVGFLFAGHETTASTLAWAIYSMAVAPEIQARVAAEGDQLDEDPPSAAAVDALSYTGQVVEETLRLYPAGIGIARMARRPTTLGGHRLRRGTIVMISVYSIQRDPQRWPDPDRFDPERFRAGAESADHAAHLPFGWGPRSCLGARFATMEARLALAMIASRWTVTFAGDRAPGPVITPALRIDGGLSVHLEARSRTTATRS